MRRFAWMLVGLGLLIALAAPIWAHIESAWRLSAWARAPLPRAATFEHAVANAKVLDYQLQLMRAGLRPAWTIASPWPMAVSGAAILLFGVIILAIRRPSTPSCECASCGAPTEAGRVLCAECMA